MWLKSFQRSLKEKWQPGARSAVWDQRQWRHKEAQQRIALVFHHTVAQLLFMAMRVRQDIQMAVAFLTTRSKSPGEDDWGKLKQVLKYPSGMREAALIAAQVWVALWWHIRWLEPATCFYRIKGRGIYHKKISMKHCFTDYQKDSANSHS